MSQHITDVNLSGMDLNLLWTLHVVLEEGSVRAAARRLAVTSPAVSNALARLRDALGDPLLVRAGRGLVPTPRASALAPVLAGLFADLEGALGARFDPATTTRTFTLALTDAHLLTALPRIAARLTVEMPQARLEAVSVDTLIARGGLEGGGADVAIGPDDGSPHVHRAPLGTTEAVLVVRADHPRVHDAMSAFAERHVDVHVALGRPGRGNHAAREALAEQGLQREVAVTVPSFAGAVAVAAHTDLVAAVPREVAVALAPALPVRLLDLPASLAMPLFLTWHARTHADPGAAAFRSVVLEALR